MNLQKSISKGKEKIIWTYKTQRVRVILTSIFVFLAIGLFFIRGLKGELPYYDSETIMLIEDTQLLELTNIPVGEMTSETIVKQTFISPVEIIDVIQLKGATFSRVNDCEIDISLVDSRDNCIEQWNFNGSEIKDDEIIKLGLDVDKADMKDKQYSIVISSADATSGNAVTFLMADEDYYQSGELKISDVLQDGDLWFQVEGHDREEAYVITTVWLTIYFIAFGIWLIWRKKETKPKKNKDVNTLYVDKKKETGKTILFLSILLVWMGGLFFLNPYDDYAIESITNCHPTSAVGEIYGDLTLEQDFIAVEPFDRISIVLCNYGNFGKGKVLVELMNSSDNIMVQKWSIDRAKLTNNIQLDLDVDVIQEQGKLYVIKVSAEELNSDNAITVWTNGEKTDAEKALRYNGESQNNAISLMVSKRIFNWVAALVLPLFYAVAIIWWKMRNKEVETYAFALVLGIGLCYIFLIAPFAEPDATYHYSSAYRLSNIILNKQDVNYMDAQFMDMNGFKLHNNVDTAFVRVAEGILDSSETGNEVVEIQRHSNNLQHPIIYLGSGLALALCRILGCNFIQSYYMGRIVNLIIFAFMVKKAISIAPKFKLVILMTALLPITMQQAGGYSYDVFLNGVSFIYVALILRYIYETSEIRWIEIAKLSLLMSILAPIKVVYFSLAILAFAIPMEKYRSKKDFWIKNTVLFCVSIISGFTPQLMYVSDMVEREKATVYSFSWVLNNIGEAIYIVLNTIQVKIWLYITEILGYHMTGLAITISVSILIGFGLVLLCAGLQHESEVCSLNIGQKIIFSGVILVCFGLILGVFLLTTPYSMNVIDGIQGRYFTPLVLPFIAVCNSSKIVSRISSKYLIVVTLMLHICVINELLIKVIN